MGLVLKLGLAFMEIICFPSDSAADGPYEGTVCPQQDKPCSLGGLGVGSLLFSLVCCLPLDPSGPVVQAW